MKDETMDDSGRDSGLKSGRNPCGDDERLASLSGKIDSLAEILDRVESRLDSLYEECQRAAGGSQRMLLRQQGLAESLARVEALLHGR